MYVYIIYIYIYVCVYCACVCVESRLKQARTCVADATDLPGETALQEVIDRFEVALHQLRDKVGCVWRGLARGHPCTTSGRIQYICLISYSIITSYGCKTKHYHFTMGSGGEELIITVGHDPRPSSSCSRSDIL
jgi:hypothetical protein